MCLELIMNFRRLRNWINKDDGFHYQVGNHKLNWKEITGYLLLLCSVIFYLLQSKVDLNHTGIVWVLFIIGIVFIYLGSPKEDDLE